MHHNELGKILKEMGIADHLTCLLRNLYAGQETELHMEQRTGSKLGEECVKRAYLSPWLFAEHIMLNARLDGAQAGTKTAGRNISNLRYADDTTLIAESLEERKSLLMKVKEQSEKPSLTINIQKMKTMTIQSHLFLVNRQGNHGNSDRLHFPGLQKSLRTANTAMKLKTLAL